MLTRHECKNIIDEAFLEDNNSIMTEHDYDEELKAEFSM